MLAFLLVFVSPTKCGYRLKKNHLLEIPSKPTERDLPQNGGLPFPQNGMPSIKAPNKNTRPATKSAPGPTKQPGRFHESPCISSPFFGVPLLPFAEYEIVPRRFGNWASTGTYFLSALFISPSSGESPIFCFSFLFPQAALKSTWKAHHTLTTPRDQPAPGCLASCLAQFGCGSKPMGSHFGW